MASARALQQPGSFSVGRSSGNEFDYTPEQIQAIESIYGRRQILNSDLSEISGPVIRILRIRPDLKDQAIRCDLVLRPVYDDSFPFVALSYSWGSGAPTRSVLIGKHAFPFPVSPHLWKGLRRLRSTDKVVNVWVDAICINQRSPEDKAAQVQIMAQIFNSAEEVRIWLGGLDGMNGCKGHEIEFFRLLCLRDRPWWTRIWIIQECAYARYCPIVMAGDLTMTLRELVENWTLAMEFHVLSGDLDHRQQQTLRKHLNFLRVPFDAWREQAEAQVHRLPLMKRLQQTAEHECTDHRDRVYGLLSLVKEDQSNQISPDYQRTFQSLLNKVSLLAGPIAHEILASNRTPVASLLNMLGHAAGQEGNEEEVENILRMNDLTDSALVRCETVFHTAVKSRRYQIVRSFLKSARRIVEAPNGWYEDYWINRALEHAYISRDQGMIKLLLGASSGNSILDEDRNDSIALCIASGKGDNVAVRLLLDAGVDVNFLGPHGNALYSASESGNSETVQLLLAAGAVDSSDMRCSGICEYTGYCCVCKRLPIRQRIDSRCQRISHCPEWFGSALNVAAGKGHIEVVKVLLKSGVNVNAKSGFIGTASQAARILGRDQIFQLLLHAGAEIDVQPNSQGHQIPAEIVRGYQDQVRLYLLNKPEVEIVEMAIFLLDEEVEINLNGYDIRDELLDALERSATEEIQSLVEMGVGANSRAGFFGNILQAAISRCKSKMVKILLENGADVNVRGGYYGHPLQAACAKYDPEVVKWLLDLGADVNAQGGYYGAALQAAAEGGDLDVIRMLLEAGADVNAIGGCYGSALLAATARSEPDVVEVLLDAQRRLSNGEA